MQLIEALCRDFTNQVLKVISVKPIMEMEDQEFQKEIAKNVNLVFETWKSETKKIESSEQRQIHLRNRGGAQIVDIERNPIFKRLTMINQLRYQHNQLKQIILKTLNKSNNNQTGSTQRNFEEKALNDINEAYAQFLQINVLDLSKEG